MSKPIFKKMTWMKQFFWTFWLFQMEIRYVLDIILYQIISLDWVRLEIHQNYFNEKKLRKSLLRDSVDLLWNVAKQWWKGLWQLGLLQGPWTGAFSWPAQRMEERWWKISDWFHYPNIPWNKTIILITCYVHFFSKGVSDSTMYKLCLCCNIVYIMSSWRRLYWLSFITCNRKTT